MSAEGNAMFMGVAVVAVVVLFVWLFGFAVGWAVS